MLQTSTFFVPHEQTASLVKKVLTFTCSGHRFLAHTAAGIVYADNSIHETTLSIIGMTKSAVNVGELVPIQIDAEIVEPSWTLTPGLPVFLGSAGMFTQTPPNSPGSIILQVGVATSINSIDIKIGIPVIIS